MYFGDFRSYLRKHQAPHSHLRILTMGQEPFDVVTIIDEHKYERHYRNAKYRLGPDEDWISTGHSWNDFMRYCYVCNVGLWSQHWVPPVGGEGVYNEDTHEWVVRPARGYLQATEILLKEGCLRPTKELAHILHWEPWRVKAGCPDWCRLYGDI